MRTVDCSEYIGRKFLRDLTVVAVERLHERFVLLRLTDAETLPGIEAGQFAEVRIEGSPATFLRRPLSIHFVDRGQNELWLLVQLVGDGTRRLARLRSGDRVNVLFPLGKGFTPLQKAGERVLLVGGGVGVAPLLEYGKRLRDGGGEVTFLLGARTEGDLLQLDRFGCYGTVHVTTDDGSSGERGLVTDHPVLVSGRFDRVAACGPTPMMKAVAAYARRRSLTCEVSLENLMACGLGACLCCVEKTRRGNVCVCKEGPVFNINELTWQT